MKVVIDLARNSNKNDKMSMHKNNLCNGEHPA